MANFNIANGDTGYSVTASTTDQTGGEFGISYFTQLNNISDTLSVSSVAVTGAVPEPANLGLVAIAGVSVLGRRRAERISRTRRIRAVDR